mgnify:CR=1 FL=1
MASLKPRPVKILGKILESLRTDFIKPWGQGVGVREPAGNERKTSIGRIPPMVIISNLVI